MIREVTFAERLGTHKYFYTSVTLVKVISLDRFLDLIKRDRFPTETTLKNKGGGEYYTKRVTLDLVKTTMKEHLKNWFYMEVKGPELVEYETDVELEEIFNQRVLEESHEFSSCEYVIECGQNRYLITQLEDWRIFIKKEGLERSAALVCTTDKRSNRLFKILRHRG